MATLARNYHKNLQKDPTRTTEEECTEQIMAALTAIPESQLMNNPERSPLNQLISEAAIRKVLKFTKNNTSTGMNGCPYKR